MKGNSVEEKAIEEEALRRLIEESYGALAWLQGLVQLSDRARAYKAKKLQEALIAAEAAVKFSTERRDVSYLYRETGHLEAHRIIRFIYENRLPFGLVQKMFELAKALRRKERT